MPYKPIDEYEPIEVSFINKRRYEGHHTICQFLRDIYHMTDDEEIKMKCRMGMSVTKAMHDKLKEYADKAREMEESKKEINTDAI